jgi:simple sugar transport system ATP-binding protein
MSSEPPVVLEARGIVHAYAAVRTLDGVDFRLRRGEVHALMGQNGAGKSTLIKILTGVCAPAAGTITLEGRAIQPASPLEAQNLGISTVYQEVNLCANLSVAENIVAGREPLRAWSRGGGIDWPALHAHARERLAGLNLDVDVRRELGSYPVAIQQMVAIARALDVSARVLILDEPTSSLDRDEVRELFASLERLRAGGMAILFVTHFLDQVYAIADRITVLRNGRLVGEHRTVDLDHAALVAAMVGRSISLPSRASAPAASMRTDVPPVMAARGLARRGSVRALDFELRPGEILGLAGLLGSGRTEAARLLFGLDRTDSGELAMNGEPVVLAAPAQAIARGVGFCPEERKAEGVIDELSVRDNIVLTLQARLGLWRRIDPVKRRALTDRLAAALDVRAADLDGPIGELSGGNQQKCLIARALATNPKVLILDEPTRGIDVAGKQEIMAELVKLARAGMALIFISAEIDELLRVSTRIVVMRDREQAGELPGGCSEDAVYGMIAAAGAAPP